MPTPPAATGCGTCPEGFTGRVARVNALVSALLTALLLGGCGLTIPADPEGTLDRVRGGFLRVGVSPRPPWTELPTGDDGDPAGIEVELLEAFAAELDAEVVWEVGGEEQLFGDLEDGRLDVVAGGLTARSPWASKAALTRPYVTVPGSRGEEENHVMAAPMGENAFLVALERFLIAQDVQADMGGLR